MPQSSPPRRYATQLEAAEYLHCNERTIRRLIADGRITGYRIGRRFVRVDLNELDSALQRIPAAGGSNVA
jgi:excisionase family DNA binding protein